MTVFNAYCIILLPLRSRTLTTADHIQSLFADTRRAIDPVRAARLSAALSSNAPLDLAIAQAAQDAAAEPLQDLLAYREALKERAAPSRLAARLAAEASNLDRRADRLAEQAAECFGKAAYRSGRGDGDLAADFERRAQAAETAASSLREKAFGHRLAAGCIQARLAAINDLLDVARPA